MANGMMKIAGLALALSLAPQLAQAQTIVDDWSKIAAPPPPELKPVTVDPKTTAYLVLDFVKQSCNNDQRPRCVASLPTVAKFLDDARKHKALVVWSSVPGKTTKDFVDQLVPKDGEPSVTTSADKFIGTDLEKILKDHGIATVIVVGTTSQGAVLYTASHAAFLGFKVVAPVDGSSAASEYAELAAAWTLTNAPAVSTATTLTRFDMISWK
jgi:nicotinamidase-related amidase